LSLFPIISGETIPDLEALVDLTVRHTTPIRVFIAKITDEFIIRLNVLRTYIAAMDLKLHMIRRDKEKLSLWLPDARRPSSRTMASDEVIMARCPRVLIALLEVPLVASKRVV
jgi:hypothetical protein